MKRAMQNLLTLTAMMVFGMTAYAANDAQTAVAPPPDAKAILQKMAQIKPQSFHFMANQLTFGYYQAQQLQGVLYPHTQIQLG